MNDDVLNEIEELQLMVAKISNKLKVLAESLEQSEARNEDNEAAKEIINNYSNKKLHKEEQKELFNKLRKYSKRNEKLSQILSRLNFTFKYQKLEGEDWASLLID